jgi:putative protein-disulfide isomerase
MNIKYTGALVLLMALCSMMVLPTEQKKQKMKIIYAYDALCGWCYGFKPTMQKFVQAHEAEIEVEVISGGMITGSRIGPIGEVAPYISWAYKEVEKATGMQFGEGFLKGVLADGKAVFTSIPPALALSAYKEMKGNNTLAFAARLQKAIYYDGIEPLNYLAYGHLATEFNMDSTAFIKLMQEPNTLKQAEQEFAQANSYGVSGFPTVFVQANNKLYKLAEGYTSFENLENTFNKIKKEIQ